MAKFPEWTFHTAAKLCFGTRLDESAARVVLLIRSIEISDRECQALSESDRHWASSEARNARLEERGLATDDAFLVRRAELAYARLVRKYPMLARASAPSAAWIALLAAVVAFVLGAFSNALDPTHRINIVAFPMLGVLAWNIGVYIFLLAQSLSKRRDRGEPHALRGALASLMLKAGSLRRARPELATGVARFLDDWMALASPLYSLRAKAVLHLAAALFAAGAVAGMYARGIGYEYRAGWESTFLTEGEVRALLSVVLGPAAALTGIELPDERALAELRWTAGQPGENAAPWIHLYAVTAAMIVIVPRLLLALAAWRNARRLSRNFSLPLDDAYFRRLLHRGAPESVRIVPCSYEPPAEVTEKLSDLVRALLPHAAIEVAPPLAYGDEENYLAGQSAAAGQRVEHLILLFNLAATPEAENHELLVRGIQRLIEEGKVAHQLLVLVDESSYRRVAVEARINERRKIWRAALLPYRHAFVDLSRGDAELPQEIFTPVLASYAV